MFFVVVVKLILSFTIIDLQVSASLGSAIADLDEASEASDEQQGRVGHRGRPARRVPGTRGRRTAEPMKAIAKQHPPPG